MSSNQDNQFTLYWERTPGKDGKYQYTRIAVADVMRKALQPWRALWQLITLS